MNREKIKGELEIAKEKSPEINIINPGDHSSIDTANNLVSLLQTMYIEHGVTKNVNQLVDDIENGKVKTWFATKNTEIVATTSLVKQDGVWETGRSVCISPGQKIGKRLMLQAALDHLDNHPTEPLVAEVRVAKEHRGIPDGMATQWINFGILELVPHALAPLFGHGAPFRHETFALSASNLDPNKTIRQRVSEAINNRSTKGKIGKLHVIQEEPFRIIVPDSNGEKSRKVILESSNRDKCSLFVVEATDTNMPLIGSLIQNREVILCGTDKSFGIEGKPIILFATFDREMAIAPSEISESLPKSIRDDLQDIADQFTERGNTPKFYFSYIY